MSSMLSSQGVVLATAMVVSSTVIFLAFSRPKTNFPSSQKQALRSCLYSEEKKREKKKKRVHFAENVKDTNGNGELYRKEHCKKSTTTPTIATRKVDANCRSEIPANRIALYNGILRDRVHKMECSY